ncbi:TonB-dependent receptor plug domain-containing protein [Sphingoaurantiacus capsulatus]|uniref:TonB-dependent receptor plug domain-containing protein n=1 Tax=Sphingoaurantiacus capsulatus TaxID=1771310 RepID=A0ABV7XGQ0_9SPHN
MMPALLAAPAAAQEAAADTDASSPDESEIVVTGSRLIRRDMIAVSPITTVDAEQIQASGNVTLEDTLNEFPQIKPGNTGSTNQSGGAGVLTADLRGLGPVRTLVLVDGRRYIPADVTGLTDLSTIPDMLVERVEIVTGGASAVYGSDAIAGAVNFVLQRKFDGIKMQAQYGETTRGDGGSYKVDLMLGANSSDGRGNATLFGSYTDRNAVRFANRAFARQPFLPDAQGVLQPFGTGTIPGALIGVTTPDLGRIQGVNLLNPGGACPGPIQGVRFGTGSVPAPFCRPTDQYNYAAPNFLLRPLERWQLGGTASYEINDSIELYANTFFTRKVNAYQQAPEALNPNSAGQEAGTLIIPNADTNPLFSPALRSFFAANRGFFDSDGDGVYTVRSVSWQIAEFGNRTVETTAESYIATAGLRGDVDLFGNDWRWDSFYQYSRSDSKFSQFNRLSRSRLTLGLDAVLVNGVPQCRVQLLGCTPVTIFGTDALTPAMVNFLKINTSRDDSFTRQVAGGSLAGDLFELPAGLVSSAFGVEWRKETFDTVPDQAQLSNDLGASTIPSIINRGDVDVREIFAEVRAPLLHDIPFIKELALEGAARLSDYSTIGSVFTWKGAVDWIVSDGVRLRGSVSRAIRAPNLNELFGAPGQGFVGGADPCLAANRPTAAQKQVCLAQGVPTALIDTLQVGASQGFQVRSGGNRALAEEKADTYTLGAVFTPTFAPKLGLSIDYFNIKVDDAITQVSGQALLNSCFRTLDVASAACQSTSRLTSGNIDVIRAPLLNIASRKVSGVDVAITYPVPLPSFFEIGGEAATLALQLVATKQFDDKTQLLPGEPIIDCAGAYGGTCSSDSIRITPDLTGLLRATWSSGPASVSLQGSYLGDLKLASNAAPNQNGTLKHRMYVDLNAKWRLLDQLEIFGGLNNIFDLQPPILGFGPGGDSNSDPQTFDPLGRAFFVGARISFK